MGERATFGSLRGASRTSLAESCTSGLNNSLGAVGYLQCAENAGDVIADGSGTDMQPAGDVLVAHTAGAVRSDRQRGSTRWRRCSQTAYDTVQSADVGQLTNAGVQQNHATRATRNGPVDVKKIMIETIGTIQALCNDLCACQSG